MWTVKLKLCSMIFQRKSRCDTDTTFTQKPSIRLRTINPLLCFVIVPFKPRVNFWSLSTIHTKTNIQQTVHYQSCFSSIKIVGGGLSNGNSTWQTGLTKWCYCVCINSNSCLGKLVFSILLCQLPDLLKLPHCLFFLLCFFFRARK